MKALLPALGTTALGVAVLLTLLLAVATKFFTLRPPSGPDSMGLFVVFLLPVLAWLLVLAGALAAVGRANGREAAFEVAQEALRWAVGADGVPASELSAFTAALRYPEISGAQAGLVADLDLVADALYGRTPATRA